MNNLIPQLSRKFSMKWQFCNTMAILDYQMPRRVREVRLDI